MTEATATHSAIRSIFTGLGAIVMLAGAVESPAQAASWTVEKLNGAVVYDVEGKPGEALRTADVLAADTAVRTGAAGQAWLRNGNDVLIVGPNAVVEITERLAGSDAALKLHIGRIEAEIDAGSTVSIETPSLLASATATRFILDAGTIDSTVEVKTGILTVTSFATLEDVAIGAGRKTTVGPELDTVSVAAATTPSKKQKRRKTFFEAITGLPGEVARSVSRR